MLQQGGGATPFQRGHDDPQQGGPYLRHPHRPRRGRHHAGGVVQEDQVLYSAHFFVSVCLLVWVSVEAVMANFKLCTAFLWLHQSAFYY